MDDPLFDENRVLRGRVKALEAERGDWKDLREKDVWFQYALFQLLAENGIQPSSGELLTAWEQYEKAEQNVRLQNDREGRAKVEHQKVKSDEQAAQVAVLLDAIGKAGRSGLLPISLQKEFNEARANLPDSAKAIQTVVEAAQRYAADGYSGSNELDAALTALSALDTEAKEKPDA